VHNGVMKMAEKAVRQSVSLPPRLAKQVGSLAKSRKLSKNRMLVELIENGIDAEKRSSSSFSPWLSVSATSRIWKRPTSWAMNLAGWYSAADAATRTLGQPTSASAATSDRADA